LYRYTLEVKKKCEKQMPIKQKEMKAIGEKYKKIMGEKAKQLQEDAGKFKGDFEQLKVGLLNSVETHSLEGAWF
jgi:hypothetical protein